MADTKCRRSFRIEPIADDILRDASKKTGVPQTRIVENGSMVLLKKYRSGTLTSWKET